MIFAIADLFNYLLERGRYSPSALASIGLRPATQANFSSLNEAPPGTIFYLHPRRSLASWLIMYATHSPISHTGIRLGGGHIVDVATNGSQVRPLEAVLDGRSWLADNRNVLRHLPAEAQEAIAKAAVTLAGKSYNWSALAWLAWQALTDGNYRRQPRHPRLWLDVILLASMPAIGQTARGRRSGLVSFLPLAAYGFTLGRNELGRLALTRVRRMQQEGRITLVGTTYWGPREPQVRSPGDQFREFLTICNS